MLTAELTNIRALHERLGKVNSQPINITSFTNKRFTVNFRVPLQGLRRIVPEAIEVEEIRDTGFGMLSMCACDFWVTQLGRLPVLPIRNNDMLCRVSTKIRKGTQVYRAYYTLRSDSSSWFLGFAGSHFSHFRKKISHFVRRDTQEYYSLDCFPKDPLCRGSFKAQIASISKQRPASTIFSDVQEATDFVFQLDGSCGYSYGRDMLSFQKIDYPPWDIYFCHEYTFDFSLMHHLFSNYDLHATLDCVLFMQNVRQVWGKAKLYQGSSSSSKEMSCSERIEKLGREIEGLSLTDQKSLVANVITQMEPQDKREIANEASIPRSGRETANTIWLILALVVAAIALLVSLAAIVYAVLTAALNSLVLLTVFIFVAVIFAAIVIPRQSFAIILPAITRGYERGYELLEKNSGKIMVASHALPAPSEGQADQDKKDL